MENKTYTTTSGTTLSYYEGARLEGLVKACESLKKQTESKPKSMQPRLMAIANRAIEDLNRAADRNVGKNNYFNSLETIYKTANRQWDIRAAKARIETKAASPIMSSEREGQDQRAAAVANAIETITARAQEHADAHPEVEDEINAIRDRGIDYFATKAVFTTGQRIRQNLKKLLAEMEAKAPQNHAASGAGAGDQ